MKDTVIALASLGLLLGCARGDRQNSMFCGLQMQEAGFRIMDQFPRGTALITDPPPELFQQRIPTRAMGHPTGYSMGAQGDSGVVLGFTGEGMPALPGFGVALVDDSSEVFRGVVIFETAPGEGFPRIGTIVGESSEIPLYAMRIYWHSVNSEDCPLFGTLDSTAQ